MGYNRTFHLFFCFFVCLFFSFSTFDMDKLRKIRQLRGKERLKIGKNAKFEIDLLKSNEDMALQSREILRTFVW